MPGGDDWKFPRDNELGAMVFNMIHTAYEWKLEPSRFFELPSQDKALMMVYSNVMSKMKAASTASQKKDMKKGSKS